MPKRYSIIIVSFNCLTDLRKCINSIKRHSGPEHEIIVVDNDSNDGTKDFLKQQTGIISVINSANKGFSKACNTGAQKASGSFLVFLNPDTLVSPDWLSGLEAHLFNPKVGAVGPVSNYVAGYQKYQLYTQNQFHSGASVEDFALELRKANLGRGVKTKLLIGFCMMMRKDDFNRLGGMDENLFLGNDDLDLSWRLRNAGYFLAVATDVFIYHEGQKSFNSKPKPIVERLVQESTDALYDKLISHYGGPDKVPPPMDIWGMDWFKPSKRNLNTSFHITAEERPSVAGIIYLDENHTDLSAAETSVNSVPEGIRCIILNQSRTQEIPESKFQVDIRHNSPDRPFINALENCLNTISAEYIIFCAAGIEFTGFFNISWHKFLRDFTNIPVCSHAEPGKTKIIIKPAAIFRTDRMLEQLQLSRSDLSVTELFLTLADRFGPSPENMPVLVYHQEVSEKNKDQKYIPFPPSKTYNTDMTDMAVFYDQDKTFRDLNGNPVSESRLINLFINITPESLPNLKEVLISSRQNSAGLRKVSLFALSDMPGYNSRERLMADVMNRCWESGYYAHPVEEITQGQDESALRQFQGISTSTQSKRYKLNIVPRTEDYNLQKLVSIIIIGFNQVEYTKKCIESIQIHTIQRFELILIDNGSTDGTADFFKSVKGAQVVINDSNLGVAKGWNQGIRKARGDYLLIFNNDTLVMPHWLENLVRLAESGPGIGIVGPRSNNISGPQLIPDIGLKTEPEIFSFSQKWQKTNDLSAFEFERITGFCMLISREAFNKIGYFDERFGKGNFEDDDYCMRARYNGYKLLIANDSFVFHFGSVSYAFSSIDWQAQMNMNAKKFVEKWKAGSKALNDTYLEERPDSAEAILNKAVEAYEKQDLALSEKLFLQAAEQNNACPEVYNGLGIINFHNGRDEEAFSMFKKALELNPLDDDAASNAVDVLEKTCSPEIILKKINNLIIDFPDNKFLAREIEKRAGGITSSTSHWESHVEDMIVQKRYSEAIDFLEKILLSGTELEFCYNYLGIIAFECGDADLAWSHFSKSLELCLLNEDVLINYCDAGITLGKHQEVLDTLSRVFSYNGKNSGFYEIKQYFDLLKLVNTKGVWDIDRIISTRELNIAGENLIREGMSEKARNTFLDIIKQDPDNFRAYNNLGLLDWYQGDFKSAWDNFARSLDINPYYTDALINAFDAALKVGKIDDFKVILGRFLNLNPANEEARKLLNDINIRGKDIYQVGNFESLDDSGSLLHRALTYINNGNLDEATMVYLNVLEKKPDSFSAYNGLGVIAHKRKMYRESYKLFERAVELNPLDQDCLMNLWDLSRFLGCETDTIGKLTSALEMDPGLGDVKTAVEKYHG